MYRWGPGWSLFLVVRLDAMRSRIVCLTHDDDLFLQFSFTIFIEILNSIAKMDSSLAKAAATTRRKCNVLNLKRQRQIGSRIFGKSPLPNVWACPTKVAVSTVAAMGDYGLTLQCTNTTKLGINTTTIAPTSSDGSCEMPTEPQRGNASRTWPLSVRPGFRRKAKEHVSAVRHARCTLPVSHHLSLVQQLNERFALCKQTSLRISVLISASYRCVGHVVAPDLLLDCHWTLLYAMPLTTSCTYPDHQSPPFLHHEPPPCTISPLPPFSLTAHLTVTDQRPPPREDQFLRVGHITLVARINLPRDPSPHYRYYSRRAMSLSFCVVLPVCRHYLSLVAANAICSQVSAVPGLPDAPISWNVYPISRPWDSC